MNTHLQPYFGQFTFTGELGQDVTAVLTHHHLPKVAGHVSRVAQEAERLAIRFGADPLGAETAGYTTSVPSFLTQCG